MLIRLERHYASASIAPPAGLLRTLDRALAAARKGFEAWRKVSPYDRAKVMRKAADLMRARADDIARVQATAPPTASRTTPPTSGTHFITDVPQDPASLGGKVLRFTPDGAAPADNPTPGSLVWSTGHRNPQGLAWHPATGDLYLGWRLRKMVDIGRLQVQGETNKTLKDFEVKLPGDGADAQLNLAV